MFTESRIDDFTANNKQAIHRRAKNSVRLITVQPRDEKEGLKLKATVITNLSLHKQPKECAQDILQKIHRRAKNSVRLITVQPRDEKEGLKLKATIITNLSLHTQPKECAQDILQKAPQDKPVNDTLTTVEMLPKGSDLKDAPACTDYHINDMHNKPSNNCRDQSKRKRRRRTNRRIHVQSDKVVSSEIEVKYQMVGSQIGDVQTPDGAVGQSKKIQRNTIEPASDRSERAIEQTLLQSKGTKRVTRKLRGPRKDIIRAQQFLLMKMLSEKKQKRINPIEALYEDVHAKKPKQNKLKQVKNYCREKISQVRSFFLDHFQLSTIRCSCRSPVVEV